MELTCVSRLTVKLRYFSWQTIKEGTNIHCIGVTALIHVAAIGLEVVRIGHHRVCTPKRRS